MRTCEICKKEAFAGIYIHRRCFDEMRDKLLAYEDTGLTPEECAELADRRDVCYCNDCRWYKYNEDEGGWQCLCRESREWFTEFPLSDCSCVHCERRGRDRDE